MRILRKKIIYGCESRGEGDSPYLTRWTLIENRCGAVYLHIFHRSDADEHHDHPWSFLSLILWRGYFEETPTPCDCGEKAVPPTPHTRWYCDRCSAIRRKRVWPGMVLFRPATWRHRVVLVDNKPAVTLVIRSRYVREWGFFTKAGWQRWKEFFAERGC